MQILIGLRSVCGDRQRISILNCIPEKRVPEIETFGETLPGMMMESVVDPHKPDQLLLHTWNGRGTTTSRVDHQGKIYISKSRTDGLAASVRLAPPSLPFGSAPKLVSSIRNLLSNYAHLRPETRDLLVAFAMATWFCDCMLVAPVLYLFGPESEVSQILRLLGCFCRRPILLGDVDFGSLATLPDRLGATLLINQRNLGRRVKRALSASNRRHFSVFRGNGRPDLYGAKAFSCDGALVKELGVNVSLSPSLDPLPILTDADGEAMAGNLQPRLLRYRMVNYERVRGKKVDCRAFVPEMRDEARSWLAPICDCSELTKIVFEELLRQSREIDGARFFDPKCLVVEAALSFCHKPDTHNFLVGEMTEKVNALLLGRHEEFTLSARSAGSVLSELGLHRERVARGYKIGLTKAVREQIHQLALSYRVLSVEDGVRRCSLCAERQASQNQIQ